MAEVEFTVPGKPRGKGRPRATKGGVVYTPAETRNAEAFVKSRASDAMRGRALLAGPLGLALEIVVPIAASWPKKRQAEARAGTLRPTGAPDIDNVVKLVADGMNGVVYLDDKAIVALSAAKRYGDRPETWISVRELAPA